MDMVRRTLITGANKGIGKATVAAVLGAAEDTHVLLGSRDVARGEAAKADVIAAHPEWKDRVEVVEIDVASDESVTAAKAHVVGKYGTDGALYGIINNAGIGLGGSDTATILNVNTRGPRRVCEAFIPLLDSKHGRVVNVSSASGPMFVASCSPARQAHLTNKNVTRVEIDAFLNEFASLAASGKGDAFRAAGFGDGRGDGGPDAYGASKAALNAYTMLLAGSHPNLTINACTPGFIETDLTRPYAEARGVTPSAMGMKTPEQGTKASVHLLLGDFKGSGSYYGSDALRSPLHKYRGPGEPEYED